MECSTWVFSNGNCGSYLTEYFDDLALLDTEIDWPLQRATMWNNTADDPARATRRAAEFLVYQKVPWDLIRLLVVRTEAQATMVKQILAADHVTYEVVVRPEWYYSGARFR